MDIAFALARLVVWVFLLLLFFRFVLDLVQSFSRDWRPRGIMLVLAEAAYTVTDPPLKALRRVIPPIGLGGVQLDLAFFVLTLLCSLLLNVLAV